MSHTPFLIRLLQRFGLSPQKVLLCLFDLAALLLTPALVFLWRSIFVDFDYPMLYRWVLPLLLLGPVLGLSLGIYQSISLPPQREVRALFLLNTLLYGLILAVLFLAKAGDLYSRLIVMGSWAATCLALPILHGYCRRCFVHCRWWGRPVLILDRDGGGKVLWHYLKRHPERGLLPVEMLSLSGSPDEVRRTLKTAAQRHPLAVALLLLKAGQCPTLDYVTEATRHFNAVLVVPAMGAGFRSHWLTPRDLGGVVGLLVRQNLHDKRRLRLKRSIDLLLCLVGGVVLLPLGLGLGLAIRLDSPGPVFYRQRRVGQNGKELRIFKFRTMICNADARLKTCLAADPALRAEWKRDQKLRNDPRVTKVGAFLRKTSLDELPQILNVLRGEMSFVGPRPIVANEIAKYGEVFEEYCRVKPGITGLWQISGRNNTSYEERVEFDRYYINNWSVWMDLWVLGKTVPVVISGYGAY